MSMTLEQLLFQVREALYDAKRYGAGDWSYLTDAIAAHLAQPAQSVDVEDVRTLLECVEGEHGGDHFEADCRHCAAFDRLTAALQEKGNGSF